MDKRLASDLIGRVFTIGEQYRRENKILRTLLLERGLSRRKIDTELKKELKRQETEELALETLERVSRAIADYLDENDLPKEVIENLAEQDRSKMH